MLLYYMTKEGVTAVFITGKQYTRAEIYNILNLPEEKRGGDWNTGYHKSGNFWFLFAAVGTSGRNGHNYRNFWIGNQLVWRGKTDSSLEHKTIKDLLHKDSTVLIFTRSKDRDPFTYQGKAVPLSVQDTKPVTVFWGFEEPENNLGDRGAGEIETLPAYKEGSVQQIIVNAYERDRRARAACIAHYGYECSVCGLDFGKMYGAIAEGFIHVHHLISLAEIGGEYEVDPVRDLRPICPNCHAVIHKRRPAFSIEEIRILLNNYSN